MNEFFFDFLHFSRGMMPGAVTVQDSDVITTGPTHSIGGGGGGVQGGYKTGWGVIQ